MRQGIIYAGLFMLYCLLLSTAQISGKWIVQDAFPITVSYIIILVLTV